MANRSIVETLRAAADPALIKHFEGIVDPPVRYFIAMTPRSGSSYLCDLLWQTRRLGRPEEYLNEDFIPEIGTKIPGRSAEEYLRNIGRHRKTPNGVAGIKASWFQFDNFFRAFESAPDFSGWRFIYLTRSDTLAQAISLYCATASSVFHTNIGHSPEALGRLQQLPYSRAHIAHWLDHITEQESGWERLFSSHGISPLRISYEQIERDVHGVVSRMAEHLSVAPVPALRLEESVFRKLSDRRSEEWAARFRAEQAPQDAAQEVKVKE